MIGYRLWATYNPNAEAPTRFETMASCLFEKRSRVATWRLERIVDQMTTFAQIPTHVRDEIVRRFGPTVYEIREEPATESIVLGDDNFWTKL